MQQGVVYPISVICRLYNKHDATTTTPTADPGGLCDLLAASFVRRLSHPLLDCYYYYYFVSADWLVRWYSLHTYILS